MKFDDAKASALDDTLVIRRLTEHTSMVKVVVFADDGRLATGANAVEQMGEIRIWGADGTASQHLLRREHCFDVKDLAFSPDSRWLVATHQGTGELLGWDSRTGKPVAMRKPNLDGVRAVGFSRDGSEALGVVYSTKLARVSTATWKVIAKGGDEGGGKAPRLSAQGVLALGIRDKELCVVENGVERVLGAHAATIYEDRALAWSRDGRRLASTDNSGGIKVWDLASGAQLSEFKESARVNACALSPDGSLLLTIAMNRPGGSTVRMWNVDDRRHVATRKRSELEVGVEDSEIGAEPQSVAFVPDGRSFAIGTWGGVVVQLRVP